VCLRARGTLVIVIVDLNSICVEKNDEISFARDIVYYEREVNIENSFYFTTTRYVELIDYERVHSQNV